MTLSYEEAKERDRIASRRSMRARRATLRDQALGAYGRRCLICDDQTHENLMIVPRKGYTWAQAAIGKPIKSSLAKLVWLEKEEYPDNFTLVCGPKFSECRRKLQLLD